MLFIFWGGILFWIFQEETVVIICELKLWFFSFFFKIHVLYLFIKITPVIIKIDFGTKFCQNTFFAIIFLL